MHASQTHMPDRSEIAKGAIISGGINAVINGAIQAFLLRGQGPIPLSADAISASTHTVLGSAVPLAVSLAMILTAVAHMMVKGPKPPFYPSVFWLMVKHGLFAFGAVVTLAIVWQRAAGTLEVSVATAVVLLGIIAGLVAAAVNYLTLTASLAPLSRTRA